MSNPPTISPAPPMAKTGSVEVLDLTNFLLGQLNGLVNDTVKPLLVDLTTNIAALALDICGLNNNPLNAERLRFDVQLLVGVGPSYLTVQAVYTDARFRGFRPEEVRLAVGAPENLMVSVAHSLRKLAEMRAKRDQVEATSGALVHLVRTQALPWPAEETFTLAIAAD